MVGIVEFSPEEFGDFFAALVGRFGGEESCEFVLGGEEADEIEVGAAEEGGVGDGFGWLDAVFFKVGAEEAIDGILIGRDGCGQVGLAMSEGGLPFFFAEGEAGFPGEAFIDPLGEEGNLRGGERIGFVRHAFVGVLGGEDFDQDALIGVADLDGFGVEKGVTGFEREAAFVFSIGVALDAIVAEEGEDLVREIDLGLSGEGQEGSEEGDGFPESHAYAVA